MFKFRKLSGGRGWRSHQLECGVPCFSKTVSSASISRCLPCLEVWKHSGKSPSHTESSALCLVGERKGSPLTTFQRISLFSAPCLLLALRGSRNASSRALWPEWVCFLFESLGNECWNFFLINKCFYLFGVLGLCCFIWYAWVVNGGGYCLVAVCRLLISVVSLIVEYGL